MRDRRLVLVDRDNDFEEGASVSASTLSGRTPRSFNCETASGRVDPFTRYGQARVDMQTRVEELMGFLAESGSLDRIWREANAGAVARDKAAKELLAKEKKKTDK